MTKPRPTYETWGRNIWILPRLMTSNPEVKKYLIEVAVHWIKEADIDGWRLDTASEIDHDFWRDFRRAVRAAKPEALIIGEIPHDASPWLDGDQLDSVMNYAFRDAVIDFFAKNRITSEEFDARLARLRMQYKQQANEVLYNLLGSHDTIRFLAACDNRIERMACALIFQMTYVGMPVVYYGDEVGMTSDTSNWEDCRRTMIWNETEQDKELLEFHKKLLHIRRTHVALAHGDFSAIDVDPKKSAYAYLRHAQDQKILVILNNSPEPQSAAVRTEEVGSIPGHVLVDLLTDEHHQIRDDQVMITLKPYTGAILSELT